MICPFPEAVVATAKPMMIYRFAYMLGFHPWEDAESKPAFAEKISALFDREEVGREPPYGPALDVGCGSGIWGVQLARRGWQVTGVDKIARALRRARDRAKDANVDMRLIHGDAIALRNAGIGCGFRLVLDTGTYHALSSAQRQAMGREVIAVAAPDASILMLVRPKRNALPVLEAIRSQVEPHFPGWNVADVTPSGFELPGVVGSLLKPGEHWYWCRLRRQ